MLTQLKNLLRAMLSSVRDLVPIVAVIAFFQIVVLQQAPSELAGLLGGALCVVAGLTFFIAGLEMALFPLGETMAGAFLEKGSLPALLAFAFALGFGTTVAEPALIAVCAEAARVAAEAGAIASGEAPQGDYALGLRLTVATSVGFAIVLGVFRILKGWPIHWLIIGGYVIVVVMTAFAPRETIGIAYDSGGVTLPLDPRPESARGRFGIALPRSPMIFDGSGSVPRRLRLRHPAATLRDVAPLVARGFGLGLAETVPGRSPLIDGFGLIAFASLFPIISVMGYAQLSEFRARSGGSGGAGAHPRPRGDGAAQVRPCRLGSVIARAGRERRDGGRPRSDGAAQVRPCRLGPSWCQLIAVWRWRVRWSCRSRQPRGARSGRSAR